MAVVRDLEIKVSFYKNQRNLEIKVLITFPNFDNLQTKVDAARAQILAYLDTNKGQTMDQIANGLSLQTNVSSVRVSEPDGESALNYKNV